jgi:hypothetical protein
MARADEMMLNHMHPGSIRIWQYFNARLDKDRRNECTFCKEEAHRTTRAYAQLCPFCQLCWHDACLEEVVGGDEWENGMPDVESGTLTYFTTYLATDRLGLSFSLGYLGEPVL